MCCWSCFSLLSSRAASFFSVAISVLSSLREASLRFLCCCCWLIFSIHTRRSASLYWTLACTVFSLVSKSTTWVVTHIAVGVMGFMGFKKCLQVIWLWLGWYADVGSTWGHYPVRTPLTCCLVGAECLLLAMLSSSSVFLFLNLSTSCESIMRLNSRCGFHSMSTEVTRALQQLSGEV